MERLAGLGLSRRPAVGTRLVVKPKKELGQHWLHDIETLYSIAETANVTDKDFILEVGPGLGTLTEVLLSQGAHVTAVEYDKVLYEKLRNDATNLFGPDSAQLNLVHEDILKFDLTKMPNDYKVVANIPYYLTSNLVRVLSETPNPPAS